jgi:type III restriction enzyme
MELTPDLVGPSRTETRGIIGAAAEMNLEHLQDVRQSQLLFELTKHLLYSKFRDPGEQPLLWPARRRKWSSRRWCPISRVADV